MFRSGSDVKEACSPVEHFLLDGVGLMCTLSLHVDSGAGRQGHGRHTPANRSRSQAHLKTKSKKQTSRSHLRACTEAV